MRYWLILVLALGCGDDAMVGEDGKNGYFYGRPDNAQTTFACIEDETDSRMGAYVVCLPACDGTTCPAAPDGATAEPRCEARVISERCYLTCSASSECPSGMVCVPDEGYCAFERVDCTDDMTICAPDMECREAGTTGTYYCRYLPPS